MIVTSFQISSSLQEQGISEIRRECETIVVVYNNIHIRFDIQKSWSKTIDRFQIASKPYIKDKILLQSVIFCLSENWLKLQTQRTEEHSVDSQNNNLRKLKNPNIIPMHFDTEIPNKEYIEYIISTIKRTVKREDVLIRQVLYAALSTYTFDPINLGIVAPTSEGKTYVVTQVIRYFPKEDVWNIGSMSTKVLIRQKGTLVDSNYEPIKEKINELKKLISQAHAEIEKESLKEKLDSLIEGSKRLIDLSGKILVFLEPPHHELWNLLKPILSHDVPEIEFPYVDKNDRDGIVTKKVVVRGWSACIFCSAKDESRWEIWSEIQSRFLITSPTMNKEKYLESNVLISQRKGLPNKVQEYVIVSENEVSTARKCIEFLKQQIKVLYSSNNAGYNHNTNAVWIPYYEILGRNLESNKGADNRAANRIFSLLNIIPLTKFNLRPRLIFGVETLVVATLEDLSEALYITQNLTGIPTHKIQFFKEIFLPLYMSKNAPDCKDEKEEKRKAVTTCQLREYYKMKTGRTITSNNMKQTYLNELVNQGLVDEEDSELDKRGKIYFPLIEISKEQKISNYNDSESLDNFLQSSKIIPYRNYNIIPDNWLKLEILNLLKYPIKLDIFHLLDKNGNETCICQFIEEYEKSLKLNGYFANAIKNNSTTKIFGNMELINERKEKNIKNYPVRVNC